MQPAVNPQTETGLKAFSKGWLFMLLQILIHSSSKWMGTAGVTCCVLYFNTSLSPVPQFIQENNHEKKKKTHKKNLYITRQVYDKATEKIKAFSTVL